MKCEGVVFRFYSIAKIKCFSLFDEFVSPVFLFYSQAIFKLIPKDELSALPDDENTAEKRADKPWSFFDKGENGEILWFKWRLKSKNKYKNQLLTLWANYQCAPLPSPWDPYEVFLLSITSFQKPALNSEPSLSLSSLQNEWQKESLSRECWTMRKLYV